MASVGVVGAGAIGSYLGARLRASGSDVILLARDPHATAIEQDGLRVEDGHGNVESVIRDLSVTRDPRSLKACDYVLICVKSQDTQDAIAEVAPDLNQSATVVSVQNGVGNWRTIAETVGDHRVISAVGLLGVEFLSPGVVRLSMPGRLVVGAPGNASSETVGECCRLLDEAIPTVIADQIMGALWAKLIINLDMAILALTQEPFPAGLLDDQLRSLCLQVMREGLGVVAAAGIDISGNPVYTAMESKIELLESSGASLRERVGARGTQFRASTLQSLLRGKTTETDFLNGEIVRLAEMTGTHAALNRALCGLVAEAESTQRVYAAGELASALNGH